MKSGASSKPSKADPARKHNNKPHQPSIVIANKWTRQYSKQNNYKTSNNQPEEEVEEFANLLLVLCFLV
jgi:hypothetical protein